MCCGNKKKKLQTVNPPPAVQSGVQPITTGPAVPSSVPVIAKNSERTIPGSQIGQSRLADRSLQKSQVRVSEIKDPKVTNFFKDSKTQRIELSKITNEHSSYVRQHDYFDLSRGHQAELNNLKGLPDKRAAMYATSDGSSTSTPSIQRFYYDRNITDVSYTPANDAYKSNFYNQNIKQPQGTYSTVNAYNAYDSSVQQTPGFNQNSTTQPINYSTVQSIQPGYPINYYNGPQQSIYESRYHQTL